jgi:hypothetical protein
MVIYTLDPQNCENRPNGDLIRPFLIQGLSGPSRDRIQSGGIPEKIELNLNKLHSDENTELERFCQLLTEKTGKTIKKDDLSEIIKTREIVIEE